MQGVCALQVEYEELPFVLDAQKAMEAGRAAAARALPEQHPQAHGHEKRRLSGRYSGAGADPGGGLVRHPHRAALPHRKPRVLLPMSENGRIIRSSPPRRSRTSSAASWGRRSAARGADIRVVKPYIGGGFGNKQDALYEPLCAWCSTQVGGRCVRVDCSREETFVSNRVRHAIRFHIVSWLRSDGTFAARKVECFSNQGAYASHGHSIVAKAMGSLCPALSLRQLGGRRVDGVHQPPRRRAPCADTACRRRRSPTSRTSDECAEGRRHGRRWPSGWQNLMPKGYRGRRSRRTSTTTDSFRECLARSGGSSMDYDYDKKSPKPTRTDTGPDAPGRRRGDVLVQHGGLSPSRSRPRATACS